MGNEDGGDARLLLQPADFRAHFEAEFRVEIGERFVEEQHVRAADQSTGERHTLLLAAGKLCRPTTEEIAYMHERRNIRDLLLDIGGGDPLHHQRKADVLLDRHVRVERVGLEDDADITLLAGQVGDVPIAEQDAAGSRPVDAADGKQRRRFAATGRSEQRQHFSGAHFEVHILYDLGGAKTLGKLVEQDTHQPLVPPP